MSIRWRGVAEEIVLGVVLVALLLMLAHASAFFAILFVAIMIVLRVTIHHVERRSF